MGEIAFPAWDPVFLEIPGVPVDLRYYGLMYVVGFVLGNIILVRLARSGFLPLPVEKVGDLLFALILGVVLGGRIGYSLFYKPEIFSEPLELLKVWEGGLSFHGGLLGVIVAYMLFARKHKLPKWRVGDCLTMATCPGIFAVRMANFINGELYGRPISDQNSPDSVPWAVRFPTDTKALEMLGLVGKSKREIELGILDAYKDGTWERIKGGVPLRHPSQIYEGIAEGLVLGLLMWFIYRITRAKALGTGMYMGLFLIFYGGMRFFIEYYRMPDDHLGLVHMGAFSRGQALCFLMILIGVALLVWRRNKHLPPTADNDTKPALAEAKA
jgi:phosphatidylglycerol:prolipoprotein diacylglycerol transferase